MNRISWLLTRAKTILQTEGLIPLAKWGFPFVLRSFVRYRTCDLYEFALDDVRKLNETDFMPKIDKFTIKIVSTNKEADELEAEGLEFRSQVANARKRLEKGAIALCIFVERELANIGWAATTEEARLILGAPPIKVNFANNEYVAAGWRTNPKFRGKGLGTYAVLKKQSYLWEMGKVVERVVINKDNIASQTSYAKFGPKLYAEARYLKILWWIWWREKPLPQPNGEWDTESAVLIRI